MQFNRLQNTEVISASPVTPNYDLKNCNKHSGQFTTQCVKQFCGSPFLFSYLDFNLEYIYQALII